MNLCGSVAQGTQQKLETLCKHSDKKKMNHFDSWNECRDKGQMLLWMGATTIVNLGRCRSHIKRSAFYNFKRTQDRYGVFYWFPEDNESSYHAVEIQCRGFLQCILKSVNHLMWFIQYAASNRQFKNFNGPNKETICLKWFRMDSQCLIWLLTELTDWKEPLCYRFIEFRT